MDPGTIVTAGLGFGLVLTLSADAVLFTLEALWLRGPRSVALTAMVFVAVADGVLIAIGGWVGWQVGTFVGSPGARAAVACGLFAILAGKALLTRLLFGSTGPPENAKLAFGPGSSLGRVVAVELLIPTPAILAAAVVVAWPRLWALGTAGPFVGAVVLGGLMWRLQWVTGGRQSRRRWGSRAIPEAVTILTVGLLAGMAVWAIPR